MNYFAKLPRHRDDGGLFAFDKYEGAGAKCYVTADYASFVDHLGRLPFTGSVPPMKDEVRGLGHCFFGEPCAYELMRPGCRTKLFLDLEFDKQCNEFDEMKLLETTFEVVVNQLIAPPWRVKLEKALVFTASNKLKSSFHVIFPNIIFEDYASVFHFTRDYLMPAYRKVQCDVLKSDGSSTCFIDPLGGTHRAFRMPYQYKKTKNPASRRPLVPIDPVPVEEVGSNAWKTQVLQACAQYIDVEPEQVLSVVSKSKPIDIGDWVGDGFDADKFLTPLMKWFRAELHPSTSSVRNVSEVKLDLMAQRVFISSRDHYCDYKKGYHAHNHVCYVIDLKEMVFYQRCYEGAKCGSREKSRIDYKIPDAISRLYRDYTDVKGIEDFLNENWAL
jgi:hypothetical protein|tara:strand:- start:1336 stop:2496 length:1161 start_codon:yes stop_codon:yes gene_type:complete